MIRRARIADAAALGPLHARALWAAYGELVGHERIAAATGDRTGRWREILTRGDGETWLLERDGALVGFVSVGPPRDPDARPGDGELRALYLEPDRIGRGDGAALERFAVRRLRELGYRGATLWVMAGNARARAFYARHGWRPDDRPGENPYASWGASLRLRRELRRP